MQLMSKQMHNVRHEGTNYAKRKRTIEQIKRRVAMGEPCAICGKPIDMNLPQTFIDPKDGKRKRAPWSLEVDEIIPISQGGLPYGENCQPAHRICNQRAGAKVQKKGGGKKTVLVPNPSRNW